MLYSLHNCFLSSLTLCEGGQFEVRRGLVHDRISPSALGAELARASLAKLNRTSEKVDFFIGVTNTPDTCHPGMIHRTVGELPVVGKPTIEFKSLGVGLVQGIVFAGSYIQTHPGSLVLVVCVDLLSRFFAAPESHFNDGAGTFVISDTPGDFKVNAAEIRSTGDAFGVVSPKLSASQFPKWIESTDDYQPSFTLEDNSKVTEYAKQFKSPYIITPGMPDYSGSNTALYHLDKLHGAQDYLFAGPGGLGSLSIERLK